jgi:type IV secretion system protein VirB4
MFSYDADQKGLPQLNPLSLENNEDNKEFLASWFSSLVVFLKGYVPEREIDLIPQMVDKMFENNVSNFVAACEIFNSEETINIYRKLKIWSSGKLASIFGAESEIEWSNPIMAFDFTEIIEQKPVVIPIVNYLLHRIESNLDGGPAIIVLNEAWNLINNSIFAPQMSDFLSRMRRNNCIVIFISEGSEEVGASEVIFDIKKNITSEIYMPDPDPSYFYEVILGLNEEESEIIRMMSKEERQFLLKNRGDSVIATLDLTKLSKIKKILAADAMAIAVMEEVMDLNKDESGAEPEPEIWIPQFLEVLEDLEEERIEEEKRLEKEAAAEERRRRAALD